IAMFEAVNAIEGGFVSYLGLDPTRADASLKAAIAVAAHHTLARMYPSHTPAFDTALREDLDKIPDGEERDAGIVIGEEAAAAILALRANDGSDLVVPHVFSNEPGHWRVDPLNPTQQPLGPAWRYVKPFVMRRADQFL